MSCEKKISEVTRTHCQLKDHYRMAFGQIANVITLQCLADVDVYQNLAISSESYRENNIKKICLK